MTNICRATRKHYSAEERIRVVLDGLRGESSIASCAVVKALLRAFITPSQRIFWKPVSA